MEMINTILIVATVLSLAFAVVAAVKAKECPDSVSSFSYIVGSTPFTMWATFTALALFYPTVEALEANHLWIAVLQSLGLLMVAASPLYKTKGKIIHYVGGYLFGIMSQVVVALVSPWWLMAWVLFPTVYIKKAWHENGTFVAEAICYGTLVAALLTETF